MKTGLGLRLESMMDFQSREDPYIKEVLGILAKIREKRKDGYLDFELGRDGLVTALTSAINDRFGFNTNIITTGAPAAVIPFFGNDSHILMREFFRGTDWLMSEQDFMKSKSVLTGTVDLKGTKVFGDFTKGKSTLYLNFNKLMAAPIALTDRQICAAKLHELGHIFYPLVHMSRLDHGNLVLEQGIRDLQKDPGSKIEIVAKTLQKANTPNAAHLAAELCSSNPDVMSKAAIKLLGEEMLQQQVNAKYSNTNFEMMADNFAVRFGFGKELVTALEKLTPGGVRYGDIIRAITETIAIATQLAGIFNFIRTLAKLDNLAGKVVVSLLWFVFRGLVIATFFYTLVRMSGESSRDYTYDDLVIRYTRIRQQLIADIKQRQLSKGDATRAIESIDFIGNLIKEGRNWRTPLDHIFNTFNPEDRRAKDSIGRQQALEALVNNDLFFSSLKLSKLS